VVQGGTYKIPDPENPKKMIEVVFDPDNPDTYGTGAKDYGAALRHLTMIGVNPAAARQILDEHYDRGDMGRPIFSDYEAKILKKRLGVKKFNWARDKIRSLFAANTDEDTESAEWLINWVMGGGGGKVLVGSP